MIRVKSHKFSLLRNFKNSVEGFVEVTRNEKPMQAELLCFVIGAVAIIFLPLSFLPKAILFISLFLPIGAEMINSAIERVVDLASPEYHLLAKAAKDAGSAIVLIAIVITALIWATVLYVTICS